MAIGSLGSTDPSLQPHIRTFVVFDGSTGEVLHVHRATRFATSPSDREEPEARALRLAGKTSTDAEVVEVDSAEVNHGKSVRVDVSTRRVVVTDA